MLRFFPAVALLALLASVPVRGGEEMLVLKAHKPVSTDLLRSHGLLFLADFGEAYILEGDEASAAGLVEAGVDFEEILIISPGQDIFLLKPRRPGAELLYSTSFGKIGGGAFITAVDSRRADELDVLPFSKVRLLPGPYPAHPRPVLSQADEPVTPNRHIEAMIGEVSGDTLWQYVSQLSGRVPVTINARPDTLLTRYSHSWRIDHAADYLRERFENYGMDVAFDPYVVGRLAFYSVSFPDPLNGWVAGNDQAVYKTSDGGVSWERRPVDAPYHSFWGVCFVDSLRGWICGDGGNIYHTQDGGEVWSRQPAPGGMTLREICFVDSLNGWVVGHGGLIMRTTDGGVHWIEVDSGTTADLLGLDFRSVGRGWACGDEGVILFWDGAEWSAQGSGTVMPLLDIDFGDDYSGFAIGGVRTVLKTEDGGLTWAAKTVPEEANPFLKGVFVSGQSEAWVVGLNGTILHTGDGGEAWEIQKSRTLFGLSRVRFVGGEEGWIAGYGSTVLHTSDGGATWESQKENLPSEALIRLKNVVATKPGTASDEEVIICGHFDSISEDPYNRAPGADDNATGTAAVLEAARILAGHDFERTIKFICFSGEEQGLFGSGEYATDAQRTDDPILAVVNFDMIGYADAAPEDIDIVGNQASQWLVDLAADCAATYVPSLGSLRLIDPTMVYSDHASFWKAGYAAILGIEDLDIRYPYYHTTGDTLGNLSRSFFADAVRMGVAVVAHSARPDTASRPGPSEGVKITAALPNPFRVETSISFVTGTSGSVEVTIVGVRGRRVKSIVNTGLPAGRHTVVWNGRDERGVPVAPGVYFVNVEAGSHSDGSKVVFLR